jgi:hypothetical protein
MTIDRCQLLLTAAATGAAAVVLDPVGFAVAAPGGERTESRTGTIAYGAPDWVYLPIEIPAGVNRITVSYAYDKPTPPPGYAGNALDIGVFDESGHELGIARGFRGWSGGFRTGFTISASDATPGYLPGPVRRGTWNVIVGPYTVAPQGLTWTLTVTLSFGPDGEPFVPSHAPLRATGRGRAWYRGTCTCTPCTPTASARRPRSPPRPGPPGSTSSSPPTTTLRARRGSGVRTRDRIF